MKKQLKSIVFAEMENLMKIPQWFNAKENVGNGITFNALGLKSIKQKEIIITFALDVQLSMKTMKKSRVGNRVHFTGTTIKR